MTADNFTYDGISSRVYNLVIGSFSGSDDGNQDTGTVEMTTVKAPHTNTFLKASSTYNQQLEISFSVIKMNCSDLNDIFFSEREIAWILRWLARKDYHELKFEQEGWENIHYNAIMKVSQHMLGGRCIGFDIVATCDAPWGYDQKQTTTIDTTIKNEINLHDDSDEIGTIYPDLNIEVIESGDISIYNNLTNTTTKIKNCVAGEKIHMSNFVLESDECSPIADGVTYGYNGRHTTLYDDFNWQWMPICNYFVPQNTMDDRINKITVTGSCRITFSWCAPRKAVV